MPIQLLISFLPGNVGGFLLPLFWVSFNNCLNFPANRPSSNIVSFLIVLMDFCPIHDQAGGQLFSFIYLSLYFFNCFIKIIMRIQFRSRLLQNIIHISTYPLSKKRRDIYLNVPAHHPGNMSLSDIPSKLSTY